MQPDELRHVERLRRQASELGELARDLGATVPEHVEGSDPTGSVLVVLGRHGLPADIRVREGWRQRLEPERLASAVLDAHSDAAQRAMRAWSNVVDDRGWWRRRADLEYVVAEEPAQASRSVPEPPLGQVRDSNELAEEVMRKLRDAQAPQTASPTSAEGQDDGKHVTIQITSGGLASCAIEPDWARHHDGPAISGALSTALRRAVAGHPAPPSAGAEPDSLIADALATLMNLTATPPDPGGTR
jgi:hypothetical protein